MKNNLKLPTEMTPLLAEEIGLHLGDGSMNFYNGRGFYQLRGHIKDDREHYEKRIKPLYKALFRINVKLKDMVSSRVYGIQIWSDELVDFKHEILGLPLGKKLDFSIPPIILENEELTKSLIRGFFDTDGCVYIENKNGKQYPRIELACISKRFMKQLKQVLFNLDFRLSYYVESKKKYGWSDLHRISIKGFEMTEKWFFEIGSYNPKHLRKFRKIKYGPAEI